MEKFLFPSCFSVACSNGGLRNRRNIKERVLNAQVGTKMLKKYFHYVQYVYIYENLVLQMNVYRHWNMTKKRLNLLCKGEFTFFFNARIGIPIFHPLTKNNGDLCLKKTSY